ncbi:hypothetical protein ACDF64_03080 [Agromyces sp. MMS24-JH15]|uniref:hypothetical protein n=1 Tax=Agromyces sp. MMS24-JH15 TaxID=3243765 RepID=UPI003748E6DF
MDQRSDAPSRVRALAAEAARALAAAGARDEALADFAPARRVLGIPRAARMTPAGRVWRLGVLLVAPVGGLFGTGRVVRAQREVRRSVTANAVAVERAYRAAAVRGGYREDETVNFGAQRIDPDELGAFGASGPLVLGADGAVLVRWSAGDPTALAPFERYLAERVDLATAPPAGS